MSGDPLLRLKGDSHDGFEVIETERGAIAPGAGVIFERSGKGCCEEWSLLAGVLPDRRLDVAAA